MRFSEVGITLLAVSVLAACSSAQREQPEGNFDYLETSTIQPLTAPANLFVPKSQTVYSIPNQDAIASDGVTGAQVNVTAPIQVRAVAAGSRVEEGENVTRVYFDEVEDFDELAPSVWRGITKTVEKLDTEAVNQSEGEFLETGWLTTETTIEKDEQPFWNLLADDEAVLETRQKFMITQDTAPHGRTSSVTVELTEITQTFDGETIDETPLLARRNSEATMLNSIISEVLLEQQQTARVRKEEGIDVELGFNSDGDAAFIVDTDFETAWTLTAATFEELGFVVDDLNKTDGRYYLEYEADGGMFSGLAFWRSGNAGSVDLAEGEYEVVVIEQEDQVSVTLEQDGEALSPAEADTVFPAFADEFNRQSRL